MISRDDLLGLYGITDNPFEPALGGKPTEDGELVIDLGRLVLRKGVPESELFAAVEGFGQYKSTIDDWADGIDSKNGSGRFLVSGPEGSGVSTVANYIILRFAEASGREARVVFSRPENHKRREPAVSLFGLLYNMARKHIALPDSREELDKVYEAIMYKPKRETQHAFPLYNACSELTVALARQNVEPVVLAEDIRSSEQIAYCARAFESARLVVFTTYRRPGAVLSEFLRLDEPKHDIRLSLLSWSDIVKYIDDRWEVASIRGKSPFPDEAIHGAFDRRAWEFTHVNRILKTSFDLHLEWLAQSSSDLPDVPPPVELETLVSAAGMLATVPGVGL